MNITNKKTKKKFTTYYLPYRYIIINSISIQLIISILLLRCNF